MLRSFLNGRLLQGGEADLDKAVAQGATRRLSLRSTYTYVPGIKGAHMPLSDAMERKFWKPGETMCVDVAVGLVTDWLKEGERVFVHCYAGINRSALVTALVLVRYGFYSPGKAVNALREDGQALTNRRFVRHILEEVKRRGR